MTDEHVSAEATIAASTEAVFTALADPMRHAAIDGTGWVVAALDEDPITAVGQVFRMAMYHPNHPDGDYEIHNLVLACDRPRAIGWRPGYVSETGELAFGGWTWQYDLRDTATAHARVRLTYDWSAVGPEVRSRLTFPPFAPGHLERSLDHLAELVVR